MPTIAVSNAPRLACVFAVVVLGGGYITMSPKTAQAGQRRSFADQLGHGPGISNHPVGVIPSAAIEVPADWPRDADGAITCMTCHHTLPGTGATDPYLRDSMPKQDDPVEFCANCHGGNRNHDSASMHWTALRVAHIRAESDRRSTVGDYLDRQTRRCLACHDGVSAPDAGNPTPWNRSRGYVGYGRRSHPVGVRYPTHTPRSFGVRFNPAALLPDHIRLPEGKVGCVSCHDLYGEGRYLLTVPIKGSALCLTCHDLK